MKRMSLNLLVDFDNRFTNQEILFHLRRAVEDYCSQLVDDDDDEGVTLVDIYEHNAVNNADANRLFGGNS